MNVYVITCAYDLVFLFSTITANDVERAIELFNNDVGFNAVDLSEYRQQTDYTWIADNGNIVELDTDYETVVTTRLDNEPTE